MKSARSARHLIPLVALGVGAAFANACNEGSVAAPQASRTSSTSDPTVGDVPPANSGGDALVLPGAPPPPAPPIGPPPIAHGQRPYFGTTVTADVAPPPISGGTLLVLDDGVTAVAADPDRDAVYVVDVPSMAVTYTIALHHGDEPGRLVEDGAGRVHVALRSSGALVTLDPASGNILARRPVCPAPRGVAWDAATDFVWVACATGELVAFPSSNGPPARTLVVERDLRDVIIQNGAISVTKFRSAEVLRIGSDGTVARRDALPSQPGLVFSPPPPPGDAAPPSLSTEAGAPVGSGRLGGAFAPQVVWRAIAGPSGSILTAYQVESTSSISTETPGAYSAGGPIVHCAASVIDKDGNVASSGPSFQTLVLPVDLALSPDGLYAAVVSAGVAFTGLPKVSYWTLQQTNRSLSTVPTLPNAQPIAVAFDAAGELLVQSREPAALWITPVAAGPLKSITLSTVSRDDTGHDIFHAQAGGQIACASCHPEGGDDGHVWLLEGDPRRTPSLRGTIAGTAPYHWPGDEADLTTLANDVYAHRMSGVELDASQLSALKAWVEAIPAPPPPSWLDSNAALRGQQRFQGTAGCSACHSGAKLTNNATVSVGTGGVLSNGVADRTAFQVPPLVGVGWRTPLLHDGCAATILDRFGKCATPQHGSTAQLSTQDIADLTAYLETL